MLETIYFVDEYDNPTGEVSEKFAAHTADTQLHAAFSCYVFNQAGQFLVTQRAHLKKVWPSVWTNSCCGHPAPDERRENAIRRRLAYELGMSAEGIDLVLPHYRYTAPPYGGIIENEFCPLYVAMATSEPQPNPAEVADYKWVEWDWFVRQAQNDSNDYSKPHAASAPVWSWWCKDQLKQLADNEKFQAILQSLK
jgi:isopentenyl-diphosphate delta-isomerase